MMNLTLMNQFIERMEECGLGPESTANLSMCLYEAQEKEHPFVVIVVGDHVSTTHRAYRILNPKAKISIPPHKP